MDEIDNQIINYLVRNSRMPFSKIAKKLGVSTDTIIRRYTALKKEGMISRAQINLDFLKCGFKGKIELLIKIDVRENINTVAEKIINVQNVIAVSHTIGDYDILAVAYFSDYEQLDQIVDTLSKVKEILRLDTCICSFSKMPRKKIINRYYSLVSDQTTSSTKDTE